MCLKDVKVYDDYAKLYLEYNILLKMLHIDNLSNFEIQFYSKQKNVKMDNYQLYTSVTNLLSCYLLNVYMGEM